MSPTRPLSPSLHRDLLRRAVVRVALAMLLLVPLGDGQRLLLLQRDRRSGVLAYEGVRVFRTAEERAEYMERLGAVRRGMGMEQ